MLKAFKYFDLNNNGTVEPDEFAKAVEKIGIMIPTRQVRSPSTEAVMAVALCSDLFKLIQVSIYFLVSSSYRIWTLFTTSTTRMALALLTTVSSPAKSSRETLVAPPLVAVPAVRTSSSAFATS